MAFLNSVQLIGYLGKAPMPFNSKNKGSEFSMASLATNEPVSNEGAHKNIVEWHQLIFYEDTLCIANTLKKGTQLFIEGALCSQTWTDSMGRKHKSWNVAVKKVQVLSSPLEEEHSHRVTNFKKHDFEHSIEVADSHILAIKEALKK